jgi:sugar lactone lactonase YvrE
MTTGLSDFCFLEAPRWHEGRIWFSEFYRYHVYSAREDGSDLREEADVRTQPAGLGWLPDGRLLIVSMCDRRILRREPAEGTLLVNETFGNRVSVFDITADGRLTNQRVWAQFGPLPSTRELEKLLPGLAVAPDGACLDAEGALWIADATGGRLLRVTEVGTITDEVEPGSNVYACALGGADGRTLFACAAPDFDERNRNAACEGRLLATKVSVAGS